VASLAPPMPGNPGQAPPNPSGLVADQGQAPGGQDAQAGPSPEQMVQEYLKNIQVIVGQVDALASQHPEAGKELNAAKQALIDSMTPVAGAMTNPNGMQPPV
jgi:hypothetical protein